jgi:hypothetical protein
MFKKLFNGLTLLALISTLLAVTPAASVAAQGGKGDISPDTLLNPNGTLKLDGKTSGSLDLTDYSVQIDPQLGPVFTPLAPQNEWAAVGAQGGPFKFEINAVAVSGTDIYVGGGFYDAAGIPEADYIARWNGSQWSALSSNGSGEGALGMGPVKDLLFIGSTLYVGGYFNVYNTSGLPIANASNLARWNGSAWSVVPGLTADINDTVEAIGYDPLSNILYAGGAFLDVNGNNAADYIFGINLTNSTLVTLGHNGFGDGSLQNTVASIAVSSGGLVYAGGFFFDVRDGLNTLNEADYVAMWDGVNWNALGNNGAGDGALNGMVTALAVSGTDVYVGGWFSNAAGITEADYIAKWNGFAWSALGSDGAGEGALLSASGGSVIQAIEVQGSDVYVGGYFIGSSGIPTADYIAKWNGSTWSGLGSDGAGNGSLTDGVYDIALSGGNVYVGGMLFDVNNGGTVLPNADYFAIWNGSNWSSLGAPDGTFRNGISSMAVLGTDVYVGGYFTDTGGDPRIDYLARWDGAKWNPVGNLTQPYGALNGNVYALVVDGTDLYIGGNFNQVYNEGIFVNSPGIVKWNGSSFVSLGGLNGSVFALAADASHIIYAGGSFTNAGGDTAADNIAKWNGSAWTALAGNGFGNGAVNNAVRAIAVSGTNLIVGGGFSTVVNTSNIAITNTAYLAKWNGSAWSAMDGVTAPLGNWVYTIAVSGSDVYVGGDFFNFNNNNAMDKIAHWNGSAWSSLGDNGLGDGSLIHPVGAIAVNGSDVYVGGNFTYIYNPNSTTLNEANYVARWDGSLWSSLSTNGAGEGSLNGIVSSLMIKDNDLWVGGNFINVNNGGAVIPTADHLATFGLDSAPEVVSITCASPCATSKLSVDFTVTFSEPVMDVSELDFTLVTTGVIGAAITGVSGSGATRTVSVNTGSGNGTLHLDIPNSATILDTTFNLLTSLPYLGGQTYTVKKKFVFRSQGTNDGWVLESGATTNVGGTKDNLATTLRLGDNPSRKQYRSILSFYTANLPDNAVITSVTLKVKQQGVIGGGNPVSLFQGFMTDIRKGMFGTAALQLTDWQASASKTLGPFNTALSSGWYVINLTPGKGSVNKLATGSGLTQIRLRFSLGDNSNFVENVLSLYSGNAGSSSRPQLIVLFYTP